MRSPMPMSSLIASSRLQRPDDSRQHAEHACFRAVRHRARRRRFRKKTAITRTAEMRREDSRLSVEAKNRSVDVRLAREDANVIRQDSASENYPIHRRPGRSRATIVIAFSLREIAQSCRTTSTCGFTSRKRSRADSSFLRPTSFVPCRIWRCRFERSTRSKSTRPIVPTPAAAR